MGPKTAFTQILHGYPLGGDSEKDEFCIESDRGGFLTLPQDVSDGYIYIYKRDEIEAEALRIAKEAGFKDITVFLLCTNVQRTPSAIDKNASIKDIYEQCGHYIELNYLAYLGEELNEEYVRKEFDKLLEKYNSYGYSPYEIDMRIYSDKENYEKWKNDIDSAIFDSSGYVFIYRYDFNGDDKVKYSELMK